MKKCLIVTGGELGSISYLEAHTPKEAYVVGVDSGVDSLRALGLNPDVIVGDMDSAKEGWKQYPCEKIISPAHKDDTDTVLALKLVWERGYRDVTVFGGMGGRFDHSVAILQAMAGFFQIGGQICLLGQGNSVFFADASRPVFLPKRKDAYFSVFSFTPKAKGVTVSGAVYPLKGVTLSQTVPLGVSNEWAEEKAEISVGSGLLLIIVSQKEKRPL